MSASPRWTRLSDPPRISVIVPTLNESLEIETTLRFAREGAPHEIIVVDGGSADDTVERAATLADRTLACAAGRARQMNRGAAEATGDVLLFLHADTHLPPGWRGRVEEALAAGAIGGRFDVMLRGSPPLLRVVARAMNERSRVTGICTGDQALFVRRDVFGAVGGFESLPLFEDIALSRRLRRVGRFAALRVRVSTSARRWEKRGVWRTIGLMWLLRFGYFAGVPPTRLARLYGIDWSPDPVERED